MDYFYPSKIESYYRWHLDTARMWARYALENKKAGTDWHGCAELAHSHLKHALLIIS
jgi:hypothetical protein